MTAITTDGLFTEPFWDKAHEFFRVLRAEGPAYQARLSNGQPVWIIADYAEARAALADPRLSKDSALLSAAQKDFLASTGQDEELSIMFGDHMMFKSGEAQQRLRKLVSAAFTPRRVEKLRPRVEQLVDVVLGRLPLDEPVDLIDRVAFPLPLTVICELLGIPEPDRAPLRGWTEAMMEDVPKRTVPASNKLAKYFAELIAAKQDRPGTDLISGLLEVAEDEDRLSYDELMATLFLLLVAGHETTANAIGNSVLQLLADPRRWKLLGKDPDQIHQAIEELVRHDSPVRLATHRITLEQVRIGNVTIPAGAIVMVSLQAANRDLLKFDRPDELDLGRDASGHLAFGHGPHYCLGVSLARMELTIVLRELTRRFPDARLAIEVSQLRHKPSAIMNGRHGLPVLLAG